MENYKIDYKFLIHNEVFLALLKMWEYGLNFVWYSKVYGTQKIKKKRENLSEIQKKGLIYNIYIEVPFKPIEQK